VSSKPDSLDRLNKEWNTIAPNMLYYEQFNNEANVISDSLKEFYFKGENITAANIQSLAEAFGDRFISNGVCETASLLSKYVKVYMAVMNYQGENSLVNIELNATNLPGCYLIDTNLNVHFFIF